MHNRVSDITFYDSDALKTRWVRAPNPEHQIVKKINAGIQFKIFIFPQIIEHTRTRSFKIRGTKQKDS